MVTAGEKPGTGFYFCVQCGHRTYLEIGTDRLPNALAINLTTRLPKLRTVIRCFESSPVIR